MCYKEKRLGDRETPGVGAPTEEKPCEDTVRAAAWKPEKEASEDTKHLHLELPASGIVRKHISGVKTTQSLVLCCGSPGGMTLVLSWVLALYSFSVPSLYFDKLTCYVPQSVLETSIFNAETLREIGNEVKQVSAPLAILLVLDFAYGKGSSHMPAILSLAMAEGPVTQAGPLIVAHSPWSLPWARI